MPRDEITSRKNPLAQRARAARDGREKEAVFVEGVRLCEEALRAGVVFEFALYAAAVEEDERGARLVEGLRRACPRVLAAGESVVEFVSDTKTPQGVVAVARRRRRPRGRRFVGGRVARGRRGGARPHARAGGKSQRGRGPRGHPLRGRAAEGLSLSSLFFFPRFLLFFFPPAFTALPRGG